MTNINNPHDRFFKETFSRLEVARDFVTHYIPQDIASLLDVGSLKLTKDSFVDEELAERFSDLVYEVELKGKGKIFVYLLFEHKSYEDPEVALYLLRKSVWMKRGFLWRHWLKSGLNKGLRGESSKDP